MRKPSFNLNKGRAPAFRVLAVLILLSTTLLPTGCSRPSTTPTTREFLHRTPLKTIQVNGHQIVYVEDGQGPPMILIHGFGGAMWQYEYQQSALASSFRVVTLDLLGSGLSDKPSIQYDPQTLIDFFRSFMESLGIPRAILVGNSMGAGLAMGMALTYPDQVSHLVLISGFPSHIYSSMASSHYQRLLTNRPPLWLAKAGNWLAGRWFTKRTLEELIYDHTLITPLVIERSYQNRSRGDFLRPLYSLLDNLDKWENDIAPRIGHLVQPTLILWGEHDHIFPQSVGYTLQKTLPHARLQIINNSGHIPQWEQPVQVNDSIRRFFEASLS